ncbi:MAG: ion transporter [Xanthomarina sp.]
MQKFRSLFLNEKFILLVIFINAIVIFLQGFESNLAINAGLEHFDNFITLLFITEIIIKIREYGGKGYFSLNWNVFDFILVVIAVPSLLFSVADTSYIDLDFLLVLRVARAFKFFRFLRFFPDIDHLINGVKRAIKASLVLFLGLFIFIFIISIISTFLFRDFSPEYFGNPLKSFYSVFKVFTVEGWYEIPDQLAKTVSIDSPRISVFITVFFSLILLLGGIFGLSIVNSIFVDTMVSDNNDELEAKVLSLEKKIDQLLELNNKQL